jgi:integrator complex subunit 2
MLIACPSLIGQQEHEKRSIEWVQWLVREEAYFERCYNWNIGLA